MSGFQRAVTIATAIREQIERAIVGQREVVEEVLVAFFAGGHVLVEGFPGLGKTLLLLALARTFQGRFSRVQFTPDLMPSDITGHSIYDLASGRFTTKQGPAFTNLLLADEVNRAPAKTQSALLEVMQERQLTIDGASYPLDPPFMVLATQNPIEIEGTYPLPEAQLDRFLLKIRIGYPSEPEEADLVERATAATVGDALDVSGLDVVATPAEVLEAQRVAASVTIDRRVVEYVVRIVRSTREWTGISMGAGPRGAIALVRAARAKALLSGREFVVPDDVKELTLAALRHRIALAPELDIEGRPIDDVLEEVMESVEAPRE